MIFGKQHRYCSNCGAHHYDDKVCVTHVLSMCCDAKCRDEWELKYTRMILGHGAQEEIANEPGKQPSSTSH